MCCAPSQHSAAITVEDTENKQERQLKMLWVDKYRPKTLDQVMVHTDIAHNLKKLVCYTLSNQPFLSHSFFSFDFDFLCGLSKVTEQDSPHLLFYGPSGSGKKTLIRARLRQMFGPGAEKVLSLSLSLVYLYIYLFLFQVI